MPSEYVVSNGRKILSRIKELETLIRSVRVTLIAKHGVARVPEMCPTPEGMYRLKTRFRPSGTEEPAERDFVYISSRDLTFEKAESIRIEMECELAEMTEEIRAELASFRRSFEIIDEETRDWPTIKHDGIQWIIYGPNGESLASRNANGESFSTFEQARRHAYIHLRCEIAGPSVFGAD